VYGHPDDLDLDHVSTGGLPDPERVLRVLQEGYEAVRSDHRGEIATYIPALAETSPDLFGACIVGVGGSSIDVGDATHEFSIQSVSKPFVFALVCEAIGAESARDQIGVNSTGLPFDSVMAVELNSTRTMNPMVNAGAIATTSLVPGDTAEEKWQQVHDGLSRFAGRRLHFDEDVYASESATNFRNQGIAHLLDGYGRLRFDPNDATDVYTRQCSLLVSAHDLAVMGATLADGGVNPVTGQRVVSEATCRRVLAVLATAGLYERSGEWLFEIGLPGKSGVSGGIVTVAPGKGGLGTFSPRLDPAGNSVRGTRLTAFLSRRLGLDLFASRPVV
jgi:glutaminase